MSGRGQRRQPQVAFAVDVANREPSAACATKAMIPPTRSQSRWQASLRRSGLSERVAAPEWDETGVGTRAGGQEAKAVTSPDPAQ